MKLKKKKKRNIGRRADDHDVRDQNDRFYQLCEIGKNIIAEIDIKALFPLVVNQTNTVMGTQRSTVFLFDDQSNELWSLAATGIKDSEIRISVNEGVAGWVFKKRQPIIINDAYNDCRFSVAVDCKTGFKTKNLLCVPLINSKGDCTGVFQVLNKKKGMFDETDITFLSALSDYTAIALDNARLYEDVKEYSKSLQEQIIINESLIKLKNRLAKFVPQTVATLAETDPGVLSREKIPMEVSVLFVDLHNFTNITENYHQRLVNHMVENHFSNYIRCIHQHGGEINETAGDGIMVIFKDNPIINAAGEAVLTALEISDENRRLNNEFNYPWGDVSLHIGVSTGEAYVGTTRMASPVRDRWTYTASGFVTVLASRIGSISEKNKVFIESNTNVLICKKFNSTFVGEYELKNVSKVIQIFHVTK